MPPESCITCKIGIPLPTGTSPARWPRDQPQPPVVDLFVRCLQVTKFQRREDSCIVTRVQTSDEHPRVACLELVARCRRSNKDDVVERLFVDISPEFSGIVWGMHSLVHTVASKPLFQRCLHRSLNFRSIPTERQSSQSSEEREWQNCDHLFPTYDYRVPLVIILDCVQ